MNLSWQWHGSWLGTRKKTGWLANSALGARTTKNIAPQQQPRLRSAHHAHYFLSHDLTMFGSSRRILSHAARRGHLCWAPSSSSPSSSCACIGGGSAEIVGSVIRRAANYATSTHCHISCCAKHSASTRTSTLHYETAHNRLMMRGMAGGPKPKKPRHKKNGGHANKSNRNPKKARQQAFGNNKKKVTPKLPPRQPEAESEEAQKAPPAYLYPTASQYAYIAGCASEEAGVDPRSLFVDAREGRTPPSFLASQFEYVSPKVLGHELPDFEIPEVAFLGKSNVGKSSLINALTNKKELAKISKTPGRTQQVNYFALVKKDKCKHQGKGVYAFHPSESTGFLIDLPGYGYAAAPDDKVSDWQAKTQEFLLQRRDSTYLRRVFLLIDARHGVANFDRAVMGWFDEASIPYSIVFTKADRVGRPKLVRIVNDVCMRYHSQLYGSEGGSNGGIYQSPIVHVTSSRDGEGIETLMWAIDGDFVADEIQEEAIGDIEDEEWYHEDDEDEDQINLLEYEELEYDYDEDDNHEVGWTEESTKG